MEKYRCIEPVKLVVQLGEDSWEYTLEEKERAYFKMESLHAEIMSNINENDGVHLILWRITPYTKRILLDTKIIGNKVIM